MKFDSVRLYDQTHQRYIPLNFQPHLLRQRHRNIRTERIDRHHLPRGMHDQVHVLHRDRAQQYLIAEHQRAGDAFAPEL